MYLCIHQYHEPHPKLFRKLDDAVTLGNQYIGTAQDRFVKIYRLDVDQTFGTPTLTLQTTLINAKSKDSS